MCQPWEISNRMQCVSCFIKDHISLNVVISEKYSLCCILLREQDAV